jgi:hypothetical protein
MATTGYDFSIGKTCGIEFIGVQLYQTVPRVEPIGVAQVYHINYTNWW